MSLCFSKVAKPLSLAHLPRAEAAQYMQPASSIFIARMAVRSVSLPWLMRSLNSLFTAMQRPPHWTALSNASSFSSGLSVFASPQKYQPRVRRVAASRFVGSAL